jgi:hypothetical protein
MINSGDKVVNHWLVQRKIREARILYKRCSVCLFTLDEIGDKIFHHHKPLELSVTWHFDEQVMFDGTAMLNGSEVVWTQKFDSLMALPICGGDINVIYANLELLNFNPHITLAELFEEQE